MKIVMGWYYYRDRTKEKYSDLIDQLSEKRDTFCGIGTRKAKIRLNKLAKSNLTALLYRKSLEIEGKNIQAKAWSHYREKYYDEKSNLINELVNICLDNKVKVGYSSAETDYCGYVEPLYIVYFDLPGCEQISWHSFSKPKCPLYDGVWDGLRNSTLPKLEKAISKEFPEILK